ncbi:MAG: hypothetical protein HKN44_04115 [Ilumatobacter sp.]|nr:hypothetical protein [Ilumatobacter sp.]
MSTDPQELSPQAQDLDDLIRDVHRAEQGDDVGGPHRPDPPDDDPEFRSVDRFVRVYRTISRFAATTGGRMLIAAITLLLILLALAFVPDWGTDEQYTAPTDDDGAAPELVQDAGAPVEVATAPGTVGDPGDAIVDGEAGPPTPAELAAQEPTPLTDGTWRFFVDAGESSPLYDFAFEPTGRFFEDDAEHNEGAYDVAGATIEMTLVRVDTGTASDGANERSEEIAWTEWFTMTRTGNTMTGVWERESWIFSYDDGFVVRGVDEVATEIFARPQRPDDAG